MILPDNGIFLNVMLPDDANVIFLNVMLPDNKVYEFDQYIRLDGAIKYREFDSSIQVLHRGCAVEYRSIVRVILRGFTIE